MSISTGNCPLRCEGNARSNRTRVTIDFAHLADSPL